MTITETPNAHRADGADETRTTGPTDSTETHEAAVEAFAERVLTDSVTFSEHLGVALGLGLGLFDALAARPGTPAQVGERAGVHPRYAREWLEQQTVAGYVRCTDTTAPQDERVFELPAEVATVLLDADGGAHLGPLVQMCRGLCDVLAPLEQAYRTGGGVSYADYGVAIRHGIGGLNGPTVAAGLPVWLAAQGDVHARLSRPGARVLDLGCGRGRSAVTVARTYPDAEVVAVDLDAASVAEAREAAASAGVADRVRVVQADAASVASVVGEERFDLVMVIEALHDMGDPVGALDAAREVLAPGGVVYVADEKVADEFTAEADVVERLQYAFSVLHCLPATVAEDPVTAHGTVLRRPTMVAWAAEAGFRAVDAEVEDPFWRHYRLDAVAATAGGTS